ncbi:hypothetical protein D9756_000320 [Leucocoprinus leucothites]|uniref:Zn-dependent exopeptidase n=1 Tax=Leucocoprinus leucothites TaxID=201217 RepID=A0A8H5LNE9_9AGAR|nr:hypothetical protein D9756_000320 [Leucoagaricus leucothites]
MAHMKPEKSEEAPFENEAQVSTIRPRRPYFRRLIRLLVILTLGSFLAALHLHWNTEHNNGIWKRHGHHKFGHAAEKAFLSVPDTENAIKVSRQYAGQPHMAGTDGDFKTAELFLSILQESFGITPPERKPVFDAGTSESQDATRGIIERNAPSAWIDTYYPVMNTPLERAVQIVEDDGSVLWDADLKEHAPEGDNKDQDAAKYADAVPTFHGLSISGDVTGYLVDGNYCSKEDYDKLVVDGAPLKGSIVLCRYGGIFRGLKVKGGQENGAVGVLIYSDPRDDGTVVVENGYVPYPDGPARNPTSVQRGSVQFLSIYPGDPTTPGYPSYENATRTQGTNIPSIPSLPISWDNAKQLLQVLQTGPLQGKRVRLSNNVDTRVIPIWNVIGVIPGYIKNEVVVAGNHRDGAVDPSSGTVSTHEVIRGLGYLMKKGWKPLRTIVIASWDAEEYGLIGSTEWGEDFADWIDKHVVAYFNLDSSVSGSRFGTSGSPLLAHFIRETAQDISHPTEANRTLWDARNDDGILLESASSLVADAIRVAQTELEVAIAAADDLGVSPLGSGSDYTVFLQRNGVPSANEGFSSTLHDPVYHYHSVYDSEPWQEKYGDPGFSRHIAIAQHLGLQIMRMANAPILPFNTTHYAIQLEGYLDSVESLPETQALELDLSDVRKAIRKVKRASWRLDREKRRAERQLRRIIFRWWRHHRRHHRHGPHHPHHPHHPGRFSTLRTLFQRIRAWTWGDYTPESSPFIQPTHMSILPGGCVLPAFPELSSEPPDCTPQGEERDGIQPEFDHSHRFYQAISKIYSEDFDDNYQDWGSLEDVRYHHHGHDHKHDHPDRRHRRWRKALIRAVHRVRVVNNKLRSFEHGLISEGGIKDREWFKHLGVAPGKWLGYGATTLPGLTEAIVFDQDKAAAEHEAQRLADLLEKLAAKLRA